MTGSGRTRVFLLHGLLGTAYGHFGSQIEAWRGRYDVVPVDLPGHGRCPVDAAENYLDHAFGYVVSLLERFGPARVVAASYAGGPIAVRCAAERPDLVNSLALSGFAPGIRRDALLAQLGGFWQLAEDHPDLAATYTRLHGDRWRATLRAFSADAARIFEYLHVENLSTDVLLANGTVKSVEHTAAVNARQLGPRVFGRVIEGAGHIPSHDKPADFTAALEEFWLCGELRNLLQENESTRRLDSLETVAVLTYLRDNGICGDVPEERPETIEGWGAWAVQRLLVS
ncbi:MULTISPECIES: alpha/beta fold hydrolase [unclassified Nocardia]|uniref:alpha/beta fold hydrolase n=1 Tax=unclassified Nocardia TaxID=2637762 RepID=UPI001CE49680|nr:MULTISPECIES: alpha/beta fold hydrolase [unclassified Nocardia]